jgi:hypothetical protein
MDLAYGKPLLKTEFEVYHVVIFVHHPTPCVFFLGSIFMYVTASAPNKRSLGATNGLSQMSVSISRAIGPALSTSLFSYSVQHNILGGYAVYLPMIILSLLALILGMQLPEHVWEEKDD